MSVLLIGGSASAQSIDPDNPKPATGDFVLPMPDGGKMVFRPVFVGADMASFPLYSGANVTVGDPKSGGFKESISTIFMSGSFLGERNGKDDWLFYIGKYEITEKQFAAVMHSETPSESTLAQSEVSFLEMLTFIEKYNTWLRENHPDALPKLDESLGCVRLPTEVEWEFSARGGVEVDASKFDEPQPYGKDLNRSEWFSGPRSSHNEKKPVGVHQPNPLGLHDMLGNVSELTQSAYQIEYFQGRTGGLTAKGGNFLTQMKDLRSSMRTEIPLIQEDGRPTRQRTLGFRLVIGSPVFAGVKTIEALRENWKAYNEGKRKTDNSTQAQSSSLFTQKATISIDEARQQLNSLETDIAQLQDAPESIQRSLAYLKEAFGGFQSVIFRAEQQNADAWSRMAGYYAFAIRQQLQKIPASERVIEIAKSTGNTAQLQMVQQRHEELLANIEDAKRQYQVTMQQLYSIAPEQVLAGFQKYTEYLTNLTGTTQQIRVNELVLKQYETYSQTGRLDMELWVGELNQL